MENNHERSGYSWQNPVHIAILLGVMIPVIWVVFYTWDNTQNFPIYEQSTSAPIAIAIAEGRFPWTEIVTGFGQHITLFPHLITVFFTIVSDWNLRLETISNVLLGIVSFILLMNVVRRTYPKLVMITLVPLAFLHFSVRQNFNWVWGYMTQWHFVVLFLFLGMYILLHPKRTYWRLLGVGLCIFFSTLSNTAGLAGWVVVFLYLLAIPERNWRHILAWIGIAVVGVGVFLGLNPSTDDVISLDVYSIWKAVEFIFISIGLIFDGFQRVWTSITITMIAIVMMTTNIVYLSRETDDRPAILFWAIFALFAFGTMFMAGLLRATFFEQPYRAVFFSTWYMTPILPFWAAMIVFLAAFYSHYVGLSSPHNTDKSLMIANTLFSAMLIAGYPAATQGALQAERNYELNAVSERCVRRFVFSQQQDPNCFMLEPGIHLYNEIAAYRLAMFAHIPPESYVPPNTDAPVLIETDNPWLNLFYQDYFLAGIASEQIFHVYPDDVPIVGKIPSYPAPAYAPNETDALLAQLTDVDSFWLVRRTEYETLMPDVWETLREEGYILLDTQLREGQLIQVSRAQRIPEAAENSPIFGDWAQLRAITAVDEMIEPCETLTIESVWQGVQPIQRDYSASLKLLTPDGEQVAQSDAQLSTVGTNSWIENELYLDERTLAIPCDLPPGEYNLALSVYFYQAPNDLLTVTGNTLAGYDDLAKLASIRVTRGD